MSEKIYAWLLRLYPSQFLEAYGDEALQLFRDRARDEKGVLPRLRLWLDLLADLAISVPREHRYIQPAPIGTSVQKHWGSTPSFHVLGNGPPRFGALLFGAVLSVTALSGFSVLINHIGDYRTLRAAVAEALPSAHVRSSPRSPAAQISDDAGEEIIASGSPARQRPSQDDASAMVRVAAGEAKLNAEQRRVIDAAIKNLKEHYVDPDVAQKMANALVAHEKNGDYNAVTNGGAFADLLTTQMRDVSHDMHLEVVYSQVPLPVRPMGPTPEALARYRKELEQDNCTFKKVEILPHNIGHLKLNSFPDLSVCKSTATAAMAALNHVDAIIFDLRDNTGGSPLMVLLMAAYLFDHPEYMYNPRETPTQQSWTQSPVPGNRLADKPVYVLTSASTWSGAEQFSYDLKMLKRVTIVGETTRGGAHAGVFHRIDDHFGIGIPEVRAINPFSKTDWEGTGVEPDVKVKAANALETAEKLAESKLLKK
jgi:hypothetical protein